MAMRRPKKMARPTGASSATRLGPGMETIELTFLPDGGWEAAVASAAAARTAAALPPRWVISWSVGPGATVDRGLKLAKLHCVGVDKNGGPGDTKEHFIVAPREGILTELLVPTGGEVSPLSTSPPAQDDKSTSTSSTNDDDDDDDEDAAGVPVGRISFCGHPELHGTLCTSCGRNVLPPAASGSNGRDENGGAGGAGGREENDAADTHQVLMKGGKMMSVTAEGRRMMHINKSGRLLNSKKLSLVLDLDNTLLHCSDHPDAGRVVVPGVDGIHALRLPNQPREYYIKLRPGLRRFLAQAATMFEMTIYTAGTSQYADAVASVLDPDRSLFQGRHFSTCFTPDLGRNTKSLERIFPNGLDMALIVDDRDDVWRGEQAKNLLLVRPYKFFVGQRSVPGGPTHDAGPQPAPHAAPPTKSAVPAPVRQPQQQQQHHHQQLPTEPTPPAAGNDGHAGASGGARGGDGDSGDAVGKTEAKTEGKADAPASLEEGGSRGKAEESGVDAATTGDGKAASGSSTGLTAASDNGGRGSIQVADLGKGLARLLGKKREEEGDEDRKTSERAAAKLATGEGGGVGKRKAAVAATSASGSVDAVQPTVIDLTEEEDNAAADTPQGTAAAAAAAAAAAKTRETGEADDSDTTETEKPPDDAGGGGGGDDDGGGKDDGSSPAVAGAEGGTSSSSSSEVSPVSINGDGAGKGKGKGKAKDAEERQENEQEKKTGPPTPSPSPRRGKGEMLAPPMSPPKVVARSENDPQLDCTFKTLEAVHGAFYAPENGGHGERRAAAEFLAKVRLRVLQGVRMVFSGVIPVSGAPADPRTHRLWKMAESHGARVDSVIGPHTTHVVAVRLGTAKTKTGLRMPGVFVVHLDWLMNSVWHCRRERETMFLLAGQICGGDPPPMPAPLPVQDTKDASPSQAADGGKSARLASSSPSSAEQNGDVKGNADHRGDKDGGDTRIGTEPGTAGGRRKPPGYKRGESSDRSAAAYSSSGSGSESGDGARGAASGNPTSGSEKFGRKRRRTGDDEGESRRAGAGDSRRLGGEERESDRSRGGSSVCSRASSSGSGSFYGDDGSGSSVGSDLDGLVDELEL